MVRRRLSFLRMPLLFALLAAPAAADHVKDVRVALDGLRRNNLAEADKVFLKDASRDGSDRLLALYELGSCYHLGGNPKRSIELFNSADAVAHEYEGQAVVSAGATGRTAGALLVNDSVLKYEGFGYEKVMSRTLNAINYLLLGDMEGARVEVRKAEEYQRLERDRHQKDVAKADQRQPQNGRLDQGALNAAYGPMNNYVANVRNSFENAFTYYLSSQIYLAQGEDGLNDAMVEIRKAYDLAPQAPGVRSAYLEIARAQGGDALDQARSALRVADPDPAPEPGMAGSAVVVYETGLMPLMDEVKINLFTPDRTYSLAFPIYREFGPAQAPLGVSTPGRTLFTAPIVNTRAMAVKSLQERMPGILTRGVLGAVAKGEMQKKAEQSFGPLGGLFSKVASVALTSADRRSWLTLPAEVQVAKCSLPAGANLLTLSAPGLYDRITLNVAPGSHSFIFVRAFPGFRRIDVKTIDRSGADITQTLAGAPSGQPEAKL